MISIHMQISEVEREIKLRHQVYYRQVACGKMRQSIADYHIRIMDAVLETLKRVRDEQTTTHDDDGRATTVAL